MKIVHVVPAISEEASGPSYSVPRLCEALLTHGEDVTLAALAWSLGDRNLPYLKTFPMDAGWPRRLGSSRAMRLWLNATATSNEPTVLHDHGMWQMNALYPAWAVRKNPGSCKLVVSPRGALSDWAMQHGSPTKKLFWPLLQRRALDAAACFHATAKSEYEDIRRLGFRQPVAIIPNGMELPDLASTAPVTGRHKTLLFMGRIHKKKGLDMLLQAWASLQDRFPDWKLVVAGGDTGYGARSGYLAQMQRLAVELGAVGVEFAGELRGDEKWAAYREASVFVLPTYSENFGITVAEALASATPAIVTRGAPWSGLETEQAGWWTEVSVQGITNALVDAMSRSPVELAQMGERGRQWVCREFRWDHIGGKMALTYHWLTGLIDQRPDWIVTD